MEILTALNIIMLVINAAGQWRWWWIEYPRKKRIDHDYQLLRDLIDVALDMAGDARATASILKQKNIPDDDPKLLELKDKILHKRIEAFDDSGHRRLSELQALKDHFNDDELNNSWDSSLKIMQGAVEMAGGLGAEDYLELGYIYRGMAVRGYKKVTEL